MNQEIIRHLRAAASLTSDNRLSLLLLGLIEYARWTPYAEPDDTDALAQRVEDDAAEIAGELRATTANQRDPIAQHEFWRAAE